MRNAHRVALTIPRRNMQDADAELAWRVDWWIGQAGFGADGISGAGCAGKAGLTAPTC